MKRATVATSNRPREAITLLEYAMGLGACSSESLRLLADLYYRVHDRDALAALAASAKSLLSADDLSRIERALLTPLSKPHDAPPETLATARLPHVLTS